MNAHTTYKATRGQSGSVFEQTTDAMFVTSYLIGCILARNICDRRVH